MKLTKILIIALLVLVLSFTFIACKKDIEINGFSIDLSQVSLEIEQGTDFDFSKVRVDATRVDETSVSVPQGSYTVDFGDFDKDVVGEYTIAVKYGNYDTKYFIIKVIAPQSEATIDYLTVKSTTHKTNFAYNEDFSYAGLVVEVFYTNNTSVVISDGYTIDSTEYNKAHGFSSSKDYLIIVSFDGKSTSYSVTVAADPSQVMKSAKAIGRMKTNYKYYEDFSSENLQLQITMLDDSIEIMDGGFEVDSSAFNKLHGQSTAQTYSINVSFREITATYDVVVARALVSVVGIDASVSDTTFAYGEAFSVKGAKFYAQYENSALIVELTVADEYGEGKCIVASTEYNAEHGDRYQDQTYNVNVYYDISTQASYTVTVAKKPDFTNYTVAQSSTHKKVFELNEAFAYDGLVLKEVYGSYVPTVNANEGDYTISCPTFNSYVKGVYQVWATRNSSGTDYLIYSVSVIDTEDTSEAISFTVGGLSALQYVDMDIRLDGCYIEVLYDDDSTVKIYLPNDEVDIDGFDSSIVGLITLTFKYGGLADQTKDIEVLEDQATNIFIDSSSTHRTEFYLWEEFNSDGLIVKGVMESGRTITLSTNKYTVVPAEDFKNYESNNYSIIVTCGTVVTTYSISVESFKESQTPVDIFLNRDNGDIFASEISEKNWVISCSSAGTYEIGVNLGSDYLSSYKVMMGIGYAGGVFIALPQNPMGYVTVNYDAETVMELTIKITNANGVEHYNYLTIKTSLFNYFTINGDNITLDGGMNNNYFINDISNNYVFDWDIDSRYTVDTEIVKLHTYRLNSFESNEYIFFTIYIGEDEVLQYCIVIWSVRLINAFTINSEDMQLDGNGRYCIEWANYDLTAIYGFAITPMSGYSATLKHNGKVIQSISGKDLFAGRNLFEAVITNMAGKIIQTYEAIIVIEMDEQTIFSDVKVTLTSGDVYMNYYGGEYEIGNISLNGSVKEGAVAVTFELITGASVNIAMLNWSNGETLNLVDGKNQYIVILSDGTNSYQVYLTIYYKYDNTYFWNSNSAKFNGIELERMENIPGYDTAIITIPDGFKYESRLSELITFEESGNYNYSINSNGQIVIEILTFDVDLDAYVASGYAYILVVIDGELNDNVSLKFYTVTVDEMLYETLPTEPLTFTMDEENYVASIEVYEASFIILEIPYFSTIEMAYSEDVVIDSMDEIGNYMILAAPSVEFTLTLTLTSSSGAITATYIITYTIIALPIEFALDFGDDALYEYAILEIMSSGDEFFVVDVDTEGFSEVVYDLELMTVTFTVISDKLYTEGDVKDDVKDDVKVISGQAFTYDLEFMYDTYYVSFTYYFDYEFNPEMAIMVIVAFDMPILSFDFGNDVLCEYAILEIMLSESEFFVVDVDTEGFAEGVFDIELMTVTFTVISDKLYTEGGVKVITGQAITYDLVEEDGAYYVPFIYYDNYEFDPEIATPIMVVFDMPIKA